MLLQPKLGIKIVKEIPTCPLANVGGLRKEAALFTSPAPQLLRFAPFLCQICSFCLYSFSNAVGMRNNKPEKLVFFSKNVSFFFFVENFIFFYQKCLFFFPFSENLKFLAQRGKKLNFFENLSPNFYRRPRK